MKFSIGHRLFAAVLLSFLAVGALGVELVRWRLFDNFSDHPRRSEAPRLAGLARALEVDYGQHRDWSFLPADDAQRGAWLREQWRRTQTADAQASGSSSLVDRIGLEDAQRHTLAGARASALLVALTSIDTVGVPLTVDGTTVGTLVVARPQNPDDELAVAFLLQQQRRLAVVAAAGVALSVLAATWLAANFRRPIRQLVDGARLLEQGRFEARLPARRSDELGRLALAFNHLAERLADAERERAQWIADTSHELRTPLSVLRGQMEALQDGVRAATPDNIALMLRQTLALTRLVDDLHELARADAGALRIDAVPIDAWPLIEEVVQSFDDKARTAGLALHLGPPPPQATISADPERLRQVLVNLLENSVRHTATGGRINVDARPAGGRLRLSIADSTPGVPADAMARLGERFFRVEPSRGRAYGGTGLGLALVRRIVEAHGGRVEFAPSVHGGLRVDVLLPLVA